MADISNLIVFIVEPSASQGLFIKTRLQKIGVSLVTLFTNGTDSLAAMRESCPDVVFSSMHLPDMTGGDLVGQMRLDPKTSSAAFILVSSETRPHYLEPVRQGGSCAILGKPFTTEQLKKALATSLDYLNPDNKKIEIIDGISLENLRVLLVDDSKSARMHIRRVLENMGLTLFTEAVNGKEAVTIIDQQFFDLVVTDYNMPEMDGRELTEYIRTQSWQTTVPILMVSSESNQSRLAAVVQAGVSGVCDKPFETDVVKNLLQKMLRTDES
ncbi:MAG: response regulator [Verrucomicrobiota bacterium]